MCVLPVGLSEAPGQPLLQKVSSTEWSDPQSSSYAWEERRGGERDWKVASCRTPCPSREMGFGSRQAHSGVPPHQRAHPLPAGLRLRSFIAKTLARESRKGRRAQHVAGGTPGCAGRGPREAKRGRVSWLWCPRKKVPAGRGPWRRGGQ